MIGTILFKELRGVFLSPKFIATFAVCSILIIFSIYVGIKDYRTAVENYEASANLAQDNMRQTTNWGSFVTRSFRVPDPLQIFVSGVNNDVGKVSSINSTAPVKLKESVYSDETIYALFRYLDFSFIVQIILSLFAVLFTYDAINGERENGTLQLTFSNPVSRINFILGKLGGAWLGLLLPLLVPILLGILLVMLMKVPMNGFDWLRCAAFLGVSILYFSFFVALGLSASVVARRSSISFLVSLVVWVMFVLIIPRVGVMTAGQIITVPSEAEIDSQRDAFSKDHWAHHMTQMQARFAAREDVMRNFSDKERSAYNDEHEWEWIQQEDSIRKEMQKEIDAQTDRLHEDVRNRKLEQERLAYTLARFSPASQYQLAAMNIARTDVTLKSRYEDAMNRFREKFVAYAQKKQQETGQTGGFRITMDTRTGIKFSAPRDGNSLDYSDAPVFEPPIATAGEVFTPVVADCGLLVLFTILSFVGTMVKFLRYDVK